MELQTKKQLQQQCNIRTLRTLTFPTVNKTLSYDICRVPKSSGGFRTLHVPRPHMKIAQAVILKYVLNHLKVPDYLWAFEKGRSIPQMTRLHLNKEWVLSLDIKNYFTSIKQVNIMSMLESHGITDEAARLISEIVTYKFFLPQGAMTSPKVSNLYAAYTFGPELESALKELDITFTIYADDITFSFDYSQGLWDGVRDVYQNVLPAEDRIEIPSVGCGKAICTLLTDMTKKILNRHQLRLNMDKVKVMGPGRRHWICGVVANRKPNISKAQRDFLRAVVHNITVNGLEVEAAKAGREPGEFLSNLKGRIGWYHQLNPERSQRMLETINSIGVQS